MWGGVGGARDPNTPGSLQGEVQGWRACVPTRPAGLPQPWGAHQLHSPQGSSTDLLV